MRMSINQIDKEEFCINTIENDNLEKLKQHLTSGITINSFLRSRHKIWDTNCFTLLAIAAFSGSKSIVSYLIEKNAHVNQVDNLKKRTALHWAVASGNFEICKKLIEAGAEVNALDRDSITPLILAANVGDLETIKTLIKAGADMNLTDRMNSSALHYACMRFHGDIAKELVMNGCICNSNTPFSFCSPLKYLILDKQYYTAVCLIENGCDLSSEKWITDSSFAIKNKIDPDFIAWIQAYIKKPPKLMSLCRQQIRKNLGGIHLGAKIEKINLPKYLKDYLMMKF